VDEPVVALERGVVDSILTAARLAHPRETVLLLKARKKAGRILVYDVVIPPLAVRGGRFAEFPLHMLPLDLSIIGTAHSHPSGSPEPSVEDLNHFYGLLMVIASYPYGSEEDLAIYDGHGDRVPFEVEKK